jgi:hypothetical protein
MREFTATEERIESVSAMATVRNADAGKRHAAYVGLDATSRRCGCPTRSRSRCAT